MTTKISIEVIEQPKPLTREERKKQQFDLLMDKAEYATDMFLAGMNKEAALECIRKLYAFLTSHPNGCPEHLKPIFEMLEPTIEQYGAEGIKQCQE
jgi:hypothetical protein